MVEVNFKYLHSYKKFSVIQSLNLEKPIFVIEDLLKFEKMIFRQWILKGSFKILGDSNMFYANQVSL